MTYKDALICRLKIDEKITGNDLRQPAEEIKKLLIHSANMHPRNILSPTTCTTKSGPWDTAACIASI